MSDLQAAQQLRFNVLFRRLCRIGWEDPVPDDTTLVVFRRRLKASGVYERLMDRVVEQAKARGLGQGQWMVVDGTKVVSDVAIRDQLELVREGCQGLVRFLQRVRPERAAKVRALAGPLPSVDYPNRRALLAADNACGEAPLNELEDVAEPEIRRLAAQYRAVLKGEGVAGLTDPEARWGFRRRRSQLRRRRPGDGGDGGGRQ